jgi:chromosome segregation ATPase
LELTTLYREFHLLFHSMDTTMSHADYRTLQSYSGDYSKSSAKALYLVVAELVHERNVLLKALGDASENCAKLQKERDRLKAQLVELEDTVVTLRSKGKRAVADRDRLEEVARQLESEIAQLRSLTGDRDKFRQVKALIGKRLHPDNDQSGGEIEKIARAVIFREIWPEIVKIDRGDS